MSRMAAPRQFGPMRGWYMIGMAGILVMLVFIALSLDQVHVRRESINPVEIINADGSRFTGDIPIETIVQIKPQDVSKYLEKYPHALLLDVRTKAEWQQRFIEGSRLIPLDELEERALSELDPNIPVILICQDGQRSTLAAQWLWQQGFTNLMNLDGGLNAWTRAELPLCLNGQCQP